MGEAKNFLTIFNEILRLNSKILDLNIKNQQLSEETWQWSGHPNEPKIVELNIIITHPDKLK